MYSAYRSSLVAFIFLIGFVIPLAFCLYRLWQSRAQRVHASSHLERRLRELLAAPYPDALHAGLTPLERSLLVPHPYAAKPAAPLRPAADDGAAAAAAAAPAPPAAAAAAAPGAVRPPAPAAPLDDQQGCVICLEALAAGQEVLTLPCAHVFHFECCERWLQQSTACPLCKHNLRPVLQEMVLALGAEGFSEGRGAYAAGIRSSSSSSRSASGSLGGTVAVPLASRWSALV